ncbi:hypothetical protein ACH5RR_010021 [Cinchona calisaya]|uniref:SOSEKI DIX-like domain-containing protein n=1 Tax=Cinchona calisaya TaxID=153742 RepID=A0ABD3AG12_9GENT
MAGTSRSARTTATELQIPKRWKDVDKETSPERTKVWTEPSNSKLKSSADRRVPVIYYLSRNGQLEHPHFMEVPLSSPDGLYLKDVVKRLNFHRGKGMASLYSWSCKRSYKNGYVWHDLSDNDFIYPAHGQDYILKGSEILDAGGFESKPDETVTSSTEKLPEPENREFSAVKVPRRRNQSWSSFDIHEYKVYTGESVARAAADASTQTDDRRRRRRAIREIEEKSKEANQRNGNKSSREIVISSSDEISGISPAPSDSSPETLQKLMKADGKIILRSEAANEDPTPNNNPPTARNKASSVLMQLLFCGPIGFRACGPGQGKENGFSIISHYKIRLPRGGGGSNQVRKDAEIDGVGRLASGFRGKVKLEDKEYFSGSIIEQTKKDEFPALKRSNSYNADRGLQEIGRGTAKCIPRKPKNTSNMSTKNKNANDLSCSSSSSCSSTLTSCSSQYVSKEMVN